MLGNLEASLQNCDAKGFFQPADREATAHAPQFLKVAAQKNRCPKSGHTKEESPSLAGQSACSHTVPIPATPGRSVSPYLCSFSTRGHWCKEIVCVAVTLHWVPMCEGCGNCDVYFGKKGHYYEMTHCIFLTRVSHKKSRNPCSLSF